MAKKERKTNKEINERENNLEERDEELEDFLGELFN